MPIDLSRTKDSLFGREELRFDGDSPPSLDGSVGKFHRRVRDIDIDVDAIIIGIAFDLHSRRVEYDFRFRRFLLIEKERVVQSPWLAGMLFDRIKLVLEKGSFREVEIIRDDSGVDDEFRLLLQRSTMCCSNHQSISIYVYVRKDVPIDMIRQRNNCLFRCRRFLFDDQFV